MGGPSVRERFLYGQEKQSVMAHIDSLLDAAYDRDMIKVDTTDPYELSSGIMSPLYINANPWTQYPDVQRTLRDATRDLMDDVESNYLAGIATGGLTYGLLAQQESDGFTPYVGIRKASKDHRYDTPGKRIVGNTTALQGQDVALCDDVATTGGSLADATEVIDAVDGDVQHWVVPWIREEGGIRDTAEDYGVDLHGIATTHDVLQHGIDNRYITDDDVATVESFLDDPEQWSDMYREQNT